MPLPSLVRQLSAGHKSGREHEHKGSKWSASAVSMFFLEKLRRKRSSTFNLGRDLGLGR